MKREASHCHAGNRHELKRGSDGFTDGYVLIQICAQHVLPICHRSPKFPPLSSPETSFIPRERGSHVCPLVMQLERLSS